MMKGKYAKSNEKLKKVNQELYSENVELRNNNTALYNENKELHDQNEMMKKSIQFLEKSKSDLKKITIGAIAGSLIVTASNAAVSIGRDAYQRYMGSKYIYDNLVNENVFPKNLKLFFSDAHFSMMVSYIDDDGEKVERPLKSLRGYINNLGDEVLDSGRTPLEYGAALKAVGLDYKQVLNCVRGVVSIDDIKNTQKILFYQSKELENDEIKGGPTL